MKSYKNLFQDILYLFQDILYSCSEYLKSSVHFLFVAHLNLNKPKGAQQSWAYPTEPL